MPIASISGSSSSQSVRTNMEPVKGVSRDVKNKEKPEDKDVITKQNEESNAMKPGVTNNEKYKSVKQVDINAE
ncbi:MAG: hypothetical protein LBC64_04515 [Fibromonadaceae bacterium]|nr:hypothetical protein [Fibromonadaceae bacterium]